MKMPVTLNINDTDHTVEIEAGATLLEVLRNDIHQQSVHRSCEEGECGACTVQVPFGLAEIGSKSTPFP